MLPCTFHLAQSATGEELTAYHLQAALAACHCAEADYAATDWPRILSLYDRLAELDGSPIVALTRAVALAHVHGPQAGLETVAAIQDHPALASYYLLYAVMAEFETQLDDFESAAAHLRRAIQLTDLKSERTLLSQRLRDCEAQMQRPANAAA